MLSAPPESPSSKRSVFVTGLCCGCLSCPCFCPWFCSSFCPCKFAIPAFLRALSRISRLMPSTPNLPSFEGAVLRFSFPKMSGTKTFFISPSLTKPLMWERMRKPALSLSVKMIMPRFFAKRFISSRFSLSLKMPKPSVVIISPSTMDESFILSYFPSTMIASFSFIIQFHRFFG